MKNWQTALAVGLVVIVLANVFFWNTAYASNGQTSYAQGYDQGRTDESPVSYQNGFKDGNASGWNLGNQSGYSGGYEDGNYAGNITGFSLGESTGYQTGYAAGFSSGNQSGYSSGYASGFQVGDASGFDRGNSSGYSLGYSSGNSVGQETGYQSGYQVGYSEGSSDGYIQGVKDGVGTGYTERDPTYQEMVNFLATDKTDQNQYVAGSYVCWNFVAEIKNNAFQEGYRCGFVYIEFADSAHAIVCFNTTDKGLFYVEPQDDNTFTSLVVGQHYWNRAIYVTPTYDDTVVNFGIIW